MTELTWAFHSSSTSLAPVSCKYMSPAEAMAASEDGWGDAGLMSAISSSVSVSRVTLRLETNKSC